MPSDIQIPLFNIVVLFFSIIVNLLSIKTNKEEVVETKVYETEHAPSSQSRFLEHTYMCTFGNQGGLGGGRKWVPPNGFWVNEQKKSQC